MTISAPSSRTSIPPRRRPVVVDILLILGLLGMITCTGLAFLIPWLPALPASDPSLIRYVPVSDGAALTGDVVNKTDSSHSVRSVNIRILAHQRALTSDLRQAAISALRKYVMKPGEQEISDSQFSDRISNMLIILEETQTLAADGTVARSTAVILRTGSGDYQLAAYYPLENRDLVFDPPILLRPADFRPGSNWQTDGNLDSLQYRSSGSISSDASYQNPLGNSSDCLKVLHSIRLETSQQGQVITDTTYADWFCSGVGLVAEQELDANSSVLSGMEVVSSTYASNISPQAKLISVLPVSSRLDPSPSEENLPDPTGWVLNMIGRTRTANDITESTVQPLWVPANPPFLLVAGYGGDLLALDITQSPGKVLWRFHPNGLIYGQPAFDSSHKQVVFGTSGKQIIALDLNGLYRWSFNCGDNIVTHPVIVGDSLVFGSEDRNVYALDAPSGELLWQHATGGAVVASPAVDGNNVFIGSDDGVVYAFDAVSGAEQWVFSTGDAVEAPLVSENGIIYIASRDMNLYAVQAASGNQTWSAQIGHLLRTRPALGENAVYVIDEDGHLSAADKANGKLLWTSVERDYEGAPLLVRAAILAGGEGGMIVRVSEQGQRLSTVSASAAVPAVHDVDFRLGLVSGGGAAWMVDTKGYVWRFGPAWNGAVPLHLAWSSTLTTPPFKQNPFYSAPQVWNSKFVVADLAGEVYLADPVTGQAEYQGSLKNGAGNFRTGLAISGDTLLASSGNILFAVQLPQISPLWQFQADGFGPFPASVDGNQVAWVTGENNAPSPKPNQLNLVDFKTGKLVWKANLEGASLPGNAIIHAGVVYVNSPLSAYNLDSGQRIWEAPPGIALGIGQAFLSPDGETLFSELIDSKGFQNRVAAFSTLDGSQRWVRDLGSDYLSIFGTLWSDGKTLVIPLFTNTRGILALDASSGDELWRYLPDAPRLGNPSVNQRSVWFTLENGQVIVLNLSSGQETARLGLTQSNLESYNFTQSISFSGGVALAPAGWSLLAMKMPVVNQP